MWRNDSVTWIIFISVNSLKVQTFMAWVLTHRKFTVMKLD